MTPTNAIVVSRAMAGPLTVADARLEVERARSRLQTRLASAQREIRQAIDWRTVARRHPIAIALGAAAAALVVAQLIRRR